MRIRKVYRAAYQAALFITVVMAGPSLFAQGKLEVNGRMKIEGGDLAGARAVLYKNGVKERTITVDLNKFHVDMELNANYMISFEKAGFVSKKISFNTKAPDDAKTKTFLPFDFAVSLFKQYDDINIVVFNQPVGIIRYETATGDFDYDTDYTKSIQSQMQEVLDQVEAHNKEEERKAAEDAKRLAEEAKQLAKAEAEAKKQAQSDAKAELARLEQERKDQEKRDAEAARAEAARSAKEKQDALALKEAERQKEKADQEAARNTAPEVKPEPIAVAAVKESKPLPKPAPPPPVQRNETLASSMKGGDSRRSIGATEGFEASRVEPARVVIKIEPVELPERVTIETTRNEELLEEQNKVIKVISYETAGVVTEYRKVTHKWGGIYHFKNGVPCTQATFDMGTHGAPQDQLAGATRSR